MEWKKIEVIWSALEENQGITLEPENKSQADPPPWFVLYPSVIR